MHKQQSTRSIQLFVSHRNMSDCNNHTDPSKIPNHRSHALRDLFHTNDDSSSSDDNDGYQYNNDSDDDDSEGNDIHRFHSNPNEKLSVELIPTTSTSLISNDNSTVTNTVESRTTMIRQIQNVDIEVCTIGGSIEHRLWPAAEFLVSYILSPQLQQQQHDETTTSIPFLNQQQQHKQIKSNTTYDANALNHEIYQNVNEILNHFRSMTSTTINDTNTNTTTLKVIELGAGVGFTTLELAYNVYSNKQTNYNNNNHNSYVQFLLTDLQSALPILQRNVHRNFDRIFYNNNNNNNNCNTNNTTTNTSKNDTIKVQQLEWGNIQDIRNALSWYNNNHKNDDNNIQTEHRKKDNTPALLILGSDCVYWESLYNIFETTISSLLQNASSNSICLLANVRRWKRDTNYFQHQFGQFTSTKHGHLRCICIHERVTRAYHHNSDTYNYTVSNIDQRKNNTTIARQNHQRQIIRIYAIKWIPVSI
jgi:hypothetical protein